MSESNVYKTPESSLIDIQEGDELSPFYVVSTRKFLIMYFFTVGFYPIYWFYRNWDHYSQAKNISMLPLGRAIFSIFFIVSLVGKIQDEMELKSRNQLTFPAGFIAAIWIALMLVSSFVGVVEQNLGSPELVVALWAASFFGVPAVMYQVQRAINMACGDPDGHKNDQLTWKNIAWMAFFISIYGFILKEPLLALIGN
ncbi:hypothetical protein [Pleionea sp. CnH1-48]|uniref:hypothetical protein n=1 Tax=Pleionea sp. CnH1-48 TaxID=2954494 RepID=UPI0020976E5B|nr:hypothetical protein [Pleionea sp. CnH1-48]MCO7223554.1 hypothetical protein [Pleionea sp. CnH1-48]